MEYEPEAILTDFIDDYSDDGELRSPRFNDIHSKVARYKFLMGGG